MNQMTFRSLVLCKSVHHQNTRRVADRIADVLDATVVDPDETMLPSFSDFDLIGVGSGIYYGRFHRSIRDWMQRLPEDAGRGCGAFVFSSSGLPFMSRLYHLPLKRALQKKGFDVVADFACRGHDTFGPLWLLGGLNRKHPNEYDLSRATKFADQLKSRY
ncbi:MAG: flavodoxin [Pirellulaceae bacterium]|nr:flavodoxin [Pirellulaceae bacterium]